MRNIKTLIVAAYPNELKYLCKMGKKYLVCKNGTAYLAAGVGPVAASFGLTHLLEDYQPGIIISIGTAGIINLKFRIGDAVLARSASIASGAGDVYAVGDSQTIHYTTKSVGGTTPPLLKNLPKANIYCPQEISRTETRRHALLKHGHDVENLEVCALAFVAKKFKIPIISFLGLTNTVGPLSHEEWLRNEGKVMRNVSRIVKDLFL